VRDLLNDAFRVRRSLQGRLELVEIRRFRE
jgi:hypothetical protein